MPRRIFSLLLFLCAGATLPAAAGDPPGTAPQITFIKSFEGSEPEYTRVTVARTGEVVYQGGQIGEPSDPAGFRLSFDIVERIFSLGAALDYFRTNLESSRQVARMGKKQFVYEHEGERNQIVYNYTENRTARALQDLFERIARGRYLVQQMEYRLQFDRLGVLDTVRQFEQELNAGRLVDAKQFIPVLERLAADERLMRLVRSKARDLLQRLQGVGSRLVIEHGDQRAGVYARMVIDEQGRGVYEVRGFDQRPQAEPLELPAKTARRVQELLRLADYFRNARGAPPGHASVEGYRLSYESGLEHNEVAFSQPPTAPLAELVHLFERVLQQKHYQDKLQEALNKDPLTLQVALQEFGQALRGNVLADPQAFIPLLEQVTREYKDDRRLREQAKQLLAAIRAGG